MHILEVIVSPQGETTVRTRGFAGAECLQASKWLEQALGISTHESKTAEFHVAVTNQQTITE